MPLLWGQRPGGVRARACACGSVGVDVRVRACVCGWVGRTVAGRKTEYGARSAVCGVRCTGKPVLRQPLGEVLQNGRRDGNEERERQRERGTGVGVLVFASRRACTCRLADCGKAGGHQTRSGGAIWGASAVVGPGMGPGVGSCESARKDSSWSQSESAMACRHDIIPRRTPPAPCPAARFLHLL